MSGTGGEDHTMPDAAARERALEQAEQACLRRGAQLTPLRRQVLDLVLQSEAPVGAYALLDRLKADRPGAAPPTVYRALDFLLEHGLIHKVERLNAFIGCTGAVHAHDHGHPHQFLICRTCGATAEIADRAVWQAIESAAARAGFTLARATVEIEGTCARCAAA
jgi:Fur family zinc uptake transcriptional regulator